jgi:hypothetical protein
MSAALHIIEKRKARRRMLSSMIAASSVDVAAKGMRQVDSGAVLHQPGHTSQPSNVKSAYSKDLKRKYEIDTTLLGGSVRLQRSKQRKKESKESEQKKREKEDTLEEILFPAPEEVREFEASSTNQGLCDYVKLLLKGIMDKTAAQAGNAAAFNSSLVVFDDTAVQAMAVVVEEVLRGQVEKWKPKLLPLLYPLPPPAAAAGSGGGGGRISSISSSSVPPATATARGGKSKRSHASSSSSSSIATPIKVECAGGAFMDEKEGEEEEEEERNRAIFGDSTSTSTSGSDDDNDGRGGGGDRSGSRGRRGRVSSYTEKGKEEEEEEEGSGGSSSSGSSSSSSEGDYSSSEDE